jgi:hypothetical protein
MMGKVFRLGHLHTVKSDGTAHEVEIESVRLLQTRLDSIKKRHDELEPKGDVPSPIDDEPFLSPLFGESGSSPGGFPRSRSTITMVNDSPQRSSQSVNKAEKLLGLGLGSGIGEKGGEVVEGKMGKATNWLKKSFGGKQKRKGDDRSRSGSASPSPTLDVSPIAGAGLASSPSFGEVKNSTHPFLDEPLKLHSPVLPSPSTGSSEGSTSPTFERAHRAKVQPPPIITTTSASPSLSLTAPTSPPGFKFEFELPTMSPRSDAFDPITAPTSPNKKRNSQPPSPRQPASPHMSRSFSKRSSLLPPSTATALERADTLKPGKKSNGKEIVVEQGYEKKLHAYAIRMLAELEDAQKEVSCCLCCKNKLRRC